MRPRWNSLEGLQAEEDAADCLKKPQEDVLQLPGRAAWPVASSFHLLAIAAGRCWPWTRLRHCCCPGTGCKLWSIVFSFLFHTPDVNDGSAALDGCLNSIRGHKGHTVLLQGLGDELPGLKMG